MKKTRQSIKVLLYIIGTVRDLIFKIVKIQNHKSKVSVTDCHCVDTLYSLPGWQSKRQVWPQSGFRDRPQVLPHEWGTNQGSNLGSSTLPQ